ncbi:uncharacterized protein LOC133744512 [Rosa rugosa]|uniref:uncharacterized protein LOC133744512 n=1 Tax=Rosa rugosa TaxID=74645 RepID=UPI002B406D56|nr:uncharacterized protein LOC133744512 [Rosa rugosa]
MEVKVSWFKDWPWFEYSEELDKAYCFPCFHFDSYPSHHPVLTECGFQGWKNVESVRLLAHQGCAFRGRDESIDSSNSGNFKAVVKSFGRMNIEVQKVLENAPVNDKYISPEIQRQIANILANKVRTKIREEVGDAKFCILVDEPVDASNREQMAIILRFVDCYGFIRVENMRGQRYDGANNMRGEFNDLQALFQLVAKGPNKVQGEAKSVGKAMKHFDFVFCLLLMHDVMRITDFLCQLLQKKAIDILNALNFLSITKSKLQDMREDGWDNLIMIVASFCCEYDIIIPDMSAPYNKDIRACEQNITNGHYYRVNILNAVIDFQLAELDSRFQDNSLELLVLSATFDPRDNFVSFKSEDVCNLALKFYSQDFTSSDMFALDMECVYFLTDIQRDAKFPRQIMYLICVGS